MQTERTPTDYLQPYMQQPFVGGQGLMMPPPPQYQQHYHQQYPQQYPQQFQPPPHIIVMPQPTAQPTAPATAGSKDRTPEQRNPKTAEQAHPDDLWTYGVSVDVCMHLPSFRTALAAQ
jgi:hypothetical protein